MCYEWRLKLICTRSWNVEHLPLKIGRGSSKIILCQRNKQLDNIQNSLPLLHYFILITINVINTQPNAQNTDRVIL